MPAPAPSPTASATKAPHFDWFEAATAILMALTTLSTAWCSFETSRWNGKSNDALAAASRLERKAAIMHMEGNQALMVHAQIFMVMLDAQLQGHDKLSQFYLDRLAPDLRKAYDGWLAEKPFENPQADPHPFVPRLYKARYTEDVKQATAEAGNCTTEAKRMGNISAQYLSNTVLLAAVLFFAGTAGKFHLKRVRHPSLMFAIVIYLYIVVHTFLLPIA